MFKDNPSPSSQIRKVTDYPTDDSSRSSEDEVDYTKKLEAISDGVKRLRSRKAVVRMNGYDTVWKPDTGSTRELFDRRQVQEYERRTGTPLAIRPSKVKIFAHCNQQPLKLHGEFDAVLQAEEKTDLTTVLVTEDDGDTLPLMSESILEELGLGSYDMQFVHRTTTPEDDGILRPQVQRILDEHSQVFVGMGRLNERELMKLMTDDRIEPMA